MELELGLLEADGTPGIEIKNGVQDDSLAGALSVAMISAMSLSGRSERHLQRAAGGQFDLDEFVRKHDKPVVIMFVASMALKTTAIAKIAHRLQKGGLSTVLSAPIPSERVPSNAGCSCRPPGHQDNTSVREAITLRWRPTRCQGQAA